MEVEKRARLQSLVFGVAKLLQDNEMSTSDDWRVIADDLIDASRLASREVERVAIIEDEV